MSLRRSNLQGHVRDGRRRLVRCCRRSCRRDRGGSLEMGGQQGLRRGLKQACNGRVPVIWRNLPVRGRERDRVRRRDTSPPFLLRLASAAGTLRADAGGTIRVEASAQVNEAAGRRIIVGEGGKLCDRPETARALYLSFRRFSLAQVATGGMTWQARETRLFLRHEHKAGAAIGGRGP